MAAAVAVSDGEVIGDCEGEPENRDDGKPRRAVGDAAALDRKCLCPRAGLGEVLPEEDRTAERSKAATSGSDRGRDGGNRFGRRFRRVECKGEEESFV